MIVQFIHIPKTAGRAITAAYGDLIDVNLGHEVVRVPKIDLAFCVVRHPVERFLSAYFYLVRDWNRTGDYNQAASWQRLIDTWGEDVEGFIRDKGWRVCPFYHFFPQYRWAELCDIRLRFNQLQKDLDGLCDRVGWPHRKLQEHEPRRHPVLPADLEQTVRDLYWEDERMSGLWTNKNPAAR